MTALHKQTSGWALCWEQDQYRLRMFQRSGHRGMRGSDTKLGPKKHFKHIRIVSDGQSCQRAPLMLTQSPTFFSSLGSAAANNRVKTTCGAILQAATGTNEHAAQQSLNCRLLTGG